MENNFNVTTTENGKIAAIVSYASIIGWFIAYFAMHKDKKTELASYHLKQTLLLYIIGIILGVAQRIIITFLPAAIITIVFGILYLALLILWIIGLIGAIQGIKKEMPLIGKKAELMFTNL